MKKFIFLLAGLALTGFSVNAATTTNSEHLEEINIYNRGYGNSFIFVENGIEFSVFPDGQFDFNILHNNPRFSVSIGSPNVNFSFNSGYNYNAYVQYDEFGAIIQIENTPIFYDYYGRISQVGNINVFYNNFGYVSRVGGLYVHYNRRNVFSHCTGFINVYNRNYVYRPWHRYYSVPAYDYCVVYNRPYRRYYKPIRYTYSRPFYNNYRPRTSVATRRGHTINRNRSYATVNRSKRNITKINRHSTSRRYAAQNETARRNSNNIIKRSTPNVKRQVVKRENTKVVRTPSRNNSQINKTQRTREIVRNTPNRNNNSSYRISTRQKNNLVAQKPKSTNKRTYTRSSNTRNTQVAQRKSVNKPRTVQRRTVNKATNNKKTRAANNRSRSNNNTRSRRF
ncbi:hypothetical protein [Tamlana crocina]|uniref:Sperm nuclear basic protein PL-I n=1 Tax=Tamlana crocina TaxID=393006 RepID=A0ABX1DFX2_9FLAO|nr:hypothetical protein [Tamlana crocina]NJX15196.1 hypothetical protein [Tamlana crocina]